MERKKRDDAVIGDAGSVRHRRMRSVRQRGRGVRQVGRYTVGQRGRGTRARGQWGRALFQHFGRVVLVDPVVSVQFRGVAGAEGVEVSGVVDGRRRRLGRRRARWRRSRNIRLA
jgi:hypothetical protein